MDDFSEKITQNFMYSEKAKERFNRKFRKILQTDRENETDKFKETELGFSLTNSNVRATICEKENIKHPTFSYSEYNVDYMTIFSNSLEKTE